MTSLSGSTSSITSPLRSFIVSVTGATLQWNHGGLRWGGPAQSSKTLWAPCVLNWLALKSILSSLRIFLLVGSLFLTAQASLVHVYSNHFHALTSSEPGAPDQAQHESLCDLCIALLQLGSGLASHHEWRCAAQAVPDYQAVSSCPATPQVVVARLARGPPVKS